MVIEDTFDAYAPEQTLLAWSAGKDSTLCLKLILEVCRQKQLTPPLALDIDQNDQFEELTAFRSRVVDEWGIDLIIVRNDDFLDRVKKFGDSVNRADLNDVNQQALDSINYDSDNIIWQAEAPVINHLLKTVPINQAITEHHIQAMFTGIRWDEHGARENETYFSPRENPAHMRIHPILHLTERDIWEIHFGLNLPFNDLYRQGFRSLGSKTGTNRTSELPAWEQDLENTSERGMRSEEKERVMEQLRRWGYL